ncbi:MAG: serine/threonine protein kinase [Candidatus Xenobia bacterium]
MPFSPGNVIADRYQVRSPVREGGSGTVYLASDLRLASSLCAIKVMASSDADTLAHFRSEMWHLTRITHPGVPRVRDFFSYQGAECLVMDYVPGQNLRDVLEHSLKTFGQPLPPAQVLDIGLQTIDILRNLHALDPPVIHRDIKPSNLVMSPSNEIKLVDFGIAHLGIGAVTVSGTPIFAAPEQARGYVDARSDLYALAMTMLCLLVGHALPPEALQASGALARVPQSLAAVLLGAARAQPDLRYPTAAAFGDALRTVQIHAPVAQPTLTSGDPGTTHITSAGVPTQQFAAPINALDRYELLEPIGRGGMGIVYRARGRFGGADVAIKVMLGDASGMPRFEREIRILCELEHPHVVKVLDAGVGSWDQQTVPYVVMELVWYQNRGRLTASRPVAFWDARWGCGMDRCCRWQARAARSEQKESKKHRINRLWLCEARRMRLRPRWRNSSIHAERRQRMQSRAAASPGVSPGRPRPAVRSGSISLSPDPVQAVVPAGFNGVPVASELGAVIVPQPILQLRIPARIGLAVLLRGTIAKPIAGLQLVPRPHRLLLAGHLLDRVVYVLMQIRRLLAAEIVLRLLPVSAKRRLGPLPSGIMIWFPPTRIAHYARPPLD